MENTRDDQIAQSATLNKRILAQRERRDRERQRKNTNVGEITTNQQFTHHTEIPQILARVIAQRARREKEKRQLNLSDLRPNQYALNQRAHQQRNTQLQQRRFATPMDCDPNESSSITSSYQQNSSYETHTIHNNLDHSFISTTENFLGRHQPFHGDTNNQNLDMHTDERFIEENVEWGELGAPAEPIINVPPERHFLGRMTVSCESCLALHWMDEKLKNSSLSRPLFGGCCLQGKIKLPPLSTPHATLFSLYEGSDSLARAFQQDIRSYNACNAFTNLGVTMADRVLGGRGPTAFTIHGELHHRVGTLLPEPGREASYAQHYIYDASASLDQRQHRNPHLRRDVLNIIQQTLLETNRLCKLYKHAYEILRANGAENNHEIYASLHYEPGTDRRRYNLPTTNEIAVIMPGDGTKISSSRDIILRLRNHGLKRISECHPLYLPSHYVLLFPYGELGWSPDFKCKSKYPRKFADITIMDKDGYPIYRRRDTGISYEIRGKQMDNRSVVPYNQHLTEMFDCHINVEVCASVRAVKYIHKYIYKGFDKATMIFVGVGDEIQQYIDARYVGSIEAAHHILRNPMHKEWPNVVRLALHLPGMHKVPYNPEETPEQILARAEIEQSKLTAFFKYYAENPNATPYTYQQFPEHFVWENKNWHDRKQGFSIGRLYFASPNSGERFYLRLLLTAVKGPNSFDALKKVDGKPYNSFKEACVALGLLEDDVEWNQCLEEASTMKIGHQLRKLFSLILMECSPSQPDVLWTKFASKICDDCGHKLKSMFNVDNPSEEQIKDYGLFLLQEILSTYGTKLSDIPGMPEPTTNWKKIPQNRLIWEHRQYQHDGLQDEANDSINILNDEQLLKNWS